MAVCTLGIEWSMSSDNFRQSDATLLVAFSSGGRSAYV
jgi:hypothetical protein